MADESPIVFRSPVNTVRSSGQQPSGPTSVGIADETEEGIIASVGRAFVPLLENSIFQLQRPSAAVADFISATGLAIGIGARLFGGTSGLNREERERLNEDIEQMGRLARRGLGTITPFGGYDGREGGRFFGTHIEDVGGLGLGPENVLDVINRTAGLEGVTFGDTAVGRVVGNIGLPERVANFINSSSLVMPLRIPMELLGPDPLNYISFFSPTVAGRTAEAMSRIKGPATSSNFMIYRMAQLTVPPKTTDELIEIGRRVVGDADIPANVRHADRFFMEAGEASLVAERLEHYSGRRFADVVAEARELARTNRFASKMVEVYDNANLLERTYGSRALELGENWAEKAAAGQIGVVVARYSSSVLDTTERLLRENVPGASAITRAINSLGMKFFQNMPTASRRLATISGAGLGYKFGGPAGAVAGAVAGNVVERIARKAYPVSSGKVDEFFMNPSFGRVGRIGQDAAKQEARDMAEFSAGFQQKNIDGPLEELARFASDKYGDTFGTYRRAHEVLRDTITRESENIIRARGSDAKIFDGTQTAITGTFTDANVAGKEVVTGFRYTLIDKLPTDVAEKAKEIVSSLLQFGRTVSEIERKFGVGVDELGEGVRLRMIDVLHESVKRADQRRSGIVRRLEELALDIERLDEFGEVAKAVAQNRIDDLRTYMPVEGKASAILDDINSSVKGIYGALGRNINDLDLRRRAFDSVRRMTPESPIEDVIAAGAELRIIARDIASKADPTEVVQLGRKAEQAIAEWMSVPEYILHQATPELRDLMAKNPAASGALAGFVNRLSLHHASMKGRANPIADIDQVEATAKALFPQLRGNALERDLGKITRERWRRTVRSIRHAEAVAEIKRFGIPRYYDAVRIDRKYGDELVGDGSEIKKALDGGGVSRAVDISERPSSYEDGFRGLVRSGHDQFKIFDSNGREIGEYWFKESDKAAIDRYYSRISDQSSQRHFTDFMAKIGNTFKTWLLVAPAYHLKNNIGAISSNFVMGVMPEDYSKFIPIYVSKMIVNMSDDQLKKYLSSLVPSVAFGVGGGVMAAQEDDSDFSTIIGGAVFGAATGGVAGGLLYRLAGGSSKARFSDVRRRAKEYLDGVIETTEGVKTRGRLVDALEGHGAIGSGLYAIDVEADMERRIQRSGRSHLGDDLIQLARNNQITELNRKLGTVIENIHRGALAMKRIREGGTTMEAANDVFFAHFDYDDLSDGVKDTFRHPFFGLPFGTFMFKNVPFQFIQGVLNRPDKARFISQMIRGYQEEVGGSATASELKEWMYDRFPMITDRDPLTGEVEVFTGEGWFTFTDIERAIDPSLIIEEFATGTMPIPRAAAGAIIGVDLSTGADYVQGENGEVDLAGRAVGFAERVFRPARELSRLSGVDERTSELSLLQRIGEFSTGRRFTVDPSKQYEATIGNIRNRLRASEGRADYEEKRDEALEEMNQAVIDRLAARERGR